MRTHIELRTASFPADPDEAELINEGRYGRKLAEYLGANLPTFGFDIEGIHPEDWGWQIQLRNEEFNLWIGVGNYDEYEDGFLCFIEPSKPSVRRWFKKIDTTQTITRLSEALDSILSSAPGTYNLKWWTEGTPQEP